jgi:hypothetical protein
MDTALLLVNYRYFPEFAQFIQENPLFFRLQYTLLRGIMNEAEA